MKQMTEARLKELLNAAYSLGWQQRGMNDVEMKKAKGPIEQAEVMDDFRSMAMASIITLVSQA